MAAIEVGRSITKIPLNEWASLPPRQKLNVRNTYKEVVLEDPEHGFPWNEPGHQYSTSGTSRELTEGELKEIAELKKGDSPDVLPVGEIVHTVAEHLPHPHHTPKSSEPLKESKRVSVFSGVRAMVRSFTPHSSAT